MAVPLPPPPCPPPLRGITLYITCELWERTFQGAHGGAPGGGMQCLGLQLV